jgi:hypothetical protein
MPYCSRERLRPYVSSIIFNFFWLEVLVWEERERKEEKAAMRRMDKHVAKYLILLVERLCKLYAVFKPHPRLLTNFADKFQNAECKENNGLKCAMGNWQILCKGRIHRTCNFVHLPGQLIHA